MEELRSTDLSVVKKELMSYENVNFDIVKDMFSINKEVSDFKGLYGSIFECEHRGYVSIWLLCEYAKNASEWALSMTELDIALMNLTELPTNMTYLQNVEQIDLEFNPLEKELNVLEGLPNVKQIRLSSSQSKLVPHKLLSKSTYLHTCYVAMKMAFLSQDLTVAPKDIQEAKELWLKGDEISKKKAEELTLPLVEVYCIEENTQYSCDEIDEILGEIYPYEENMIFTHLYISYQEEFLAPFVGGSVDFFVLSSKDLETEELTIEQQQNLAFLMTFEFSSEEIYSTHPDWLSVYEGEMYFGIEPFHNKIDRERIIKMRKACFNK